MSCLVVSEELEIGGPSFWRVGVMPRGLKVLYTNHSWEGTLLGAMIRRLRCIEEKHSISMGTSARIWEDGSLSWRGSCRSDPG